MLLKTEVPIYASEKSGTNSGKIIITLSTLNDGGSMVPIRINIEDEEITGYVRKDDLKALGYLV